jgi:hypothetical protein
VLKGQCKRNSAESNSFASSVHLSIVSTNLQLVNHNNRGTASCYVTVSYYFIHVICSGLSSRLWSIYLYNSSIYFICIRLLDESVGEVIREIWSTTEKFHVYVYNMD